MGTNSGGLPADSPLSSVIPVVQKGLALCGSDPLLLCKVWGKLLQDSN